MKTAVVSSTVGAATCCGLAGVGAFLASPAPVSRTMVWRNPVYRFDATINNADSEKIASMFLGGRRAGGGTRERRGAGWRHRATTLGNLDLQPAYRLFDSVPPPPAKEVTRTRDSVNLDVDGKAPYCELS